MTATDVFFALVMYALGLWFFFYLLNHAAITAKPAVWLKAVMGPKWGYPLGCAMCSAFWVTLFLCIIGFVPLWMLFPVSVLHLFVDRLFIRLKGGGDED